MLDIYSAVDKVADITEYCKTNDIWTILEILGILCIKRDLGSPRNGLKGFCVYHDEHYCIVINQNLPVYLQILVAWHELGHIILDPELLMDGNCLFDYDFSGAVNASERRANLFAAEGMIDDTELIDMLCSGCSLHTAASELRVPEEFVKYKVRILREFDTPLNYVDMPDSCCLGDDMIGMENF